MRRVLLLLLLAPLVLGCGAQKESDLDAPAGALADAGSSRVEIDVASPKKPIFQAHGSFDYKRSVGAMKFVAYDNVEDEFGTPWPVEVRMIGRDFYTGWMFDGKLRWQKEEAYEPTSAEEFIVPFEGGPAPDKVLEVLMKASKKSEFLGKDDIRGVQATHYRLQVDEDAVLREHGIENGLDNHSTKPLVVDAWIDDDHLIRRLHFPSSDEEYPEAATYDFFEFGVPVDVDAPSELISRDEFERLMEQECRAREQAKPAKERKADPCAYLVGEGWSANGAETETGPVETVPAP